MLTTTLLHPEILMELGRNGHGAKVLIADGNFPITTCTPTTAKKVFLNLAPGLMTVTDVLRVLKEYMPIETATVMIPKDEALPAIHDEFVNIIGEDIPMKSLKRFEFYDAAKSTNVCLAIATGETRRFANVLLEIGVVRTAPFNKHVTEEMINDGFFNAH